MPIRRQHTFKMLEALLLKATKIQKTSRGNSIKSHLTNPTTNKLCSKKFSEPKTCMQIFFISYSQREFRTWTWNGCILQRHPGCIFLLNYPENHQQHRVQITCHHFHNYLGKKITHDTAKFFGASSVQRHQNGHCCILQNSNRRSP